MNEDGIWYEGADDRLGLLYIISNRHEFKDEMRSLDYWSMEDHLIIGEFPGQVVSSSAEITAPGPDGKTIYVIVDGYNLPTEEIRPVSEWVFNELVRLSLESGAIGEDSALNDETYSSEADDISEAPTYEEDDIVDVPDPVETTDYEIVDDTPTEEDVPPEPVDETELDIADIEYFLDILEEENEIEVKGTVETDEISKEDVLQYQEIMVNYVLDEEFMDEIDSYSIGVNTLRMGFEYEGNLHSSGIDISEEQEPEMNRDLIRATFEDDFSIGEDGEVSLIRDERYSGEDKVASKVNEILEKGKLSKADKDFINNVKTGHQAASFFSDDYKDTGFAKTIDKVDKLNSVAETIEESKQVYDNTKKLSQLKGAGGTTAKAIYTVSKVGQKVGEKVPIVGSLIKTGSEIVEKTVMLMPEIDDAVSNSDFRQGRITSGGHGSKTPQAFLHNYGERTETSNGVDYKFKYKDENGKDETISPTFWVKSTIKGKTYYIPTDEWENPIADVAIMDTDSWKPWTWDNCQVVKFSNPSVVYNDGEVYDL
ncbi:hypothetical protein MCMEM_1538 [Methanococcoides methylutens MM1]|uniref:Uncharacterized protein n=2 Tax=Methanococcoides methylutens TaxID=2226 RepID=A0A0E3SRJ5_METMT|nr:hypothetical protein MCMEM_1538 [Methanococcoides methylutens MM1]